MPVTPITDGEVVTFAIKSDGAEIEEQFGVVSIEITKNINKVAYAKIIFSDGEVSKGTFEASESASFTPGKKIEISLGYDSTNELVFKGIIINHGIKVVNGAGFLEIECYDQAIQMTAIRNNALFEKKKDSDIISTIIGNYAGLTKTVTATTTEHEQLYQYDATDWDFMLTRAEANGLIVSNSDGKVEVVKPEPTGTASLEIEYGVSVFEFDLQISSYSQLKEVESSAWDVKNQVVETVKSRTQAEATQGDLNADVLAKVMGDKAYNLASSTPLVRSEIQDWADGYAARAALSKLKGSITFIGNAEPKLNTVLTLKGMGRHFNGDGFISGVRHFVEEGLWQTTCTLGLDHKFAVQNYPDLHALPTGGLLPSVSGLQVGVVKKIDADPENQTRIQVNLPTWDADKNVWARLSTFYASQEFGSFFIPEVGDEVIIGFFNDDPRFPVILGSLYNTKNKPPYTPDAENKIKAIVTKTKMKLEFDEEKKIITIKTPGENTIIIDDDAKSITIKDQNDNMVELSESGIVFDTPKDLTITAKGSISIDSKKAITLKAATDVSIEGMNIKQKAKTALALEGSTAELKASTQVTIKGAMVMIN
jgi:Rhs element Vgr protein